MGLNINKLLIATNKNDILKRVVNTGIYKPSKVQHTVSPSMDIQVASNFERLLFDISGNDPIKTSKFMEDLNNKGEFKLGNEELNNLKKNFCSESLSEEETKLMIEEMYKTQKILVDPHTAVGLDVAKKVSLNEKVIVLATAHPSKFSKVVFESTGVKPELPENMKDILSQQERYDKLSKDLKEVQNYILERI